jgi:hypothetical protein
MIRTCLFLLFLFAAQGSIAQYIHLTDSTGVFGERVMEKMARTNNSSAAKIGQDFAALWESGLSNAQKTKIIEIALDMQSRDLKEIPYFRDFFASITGAAQLANLSGSKMDNMLEMLWQALQQNTSATFARDLAGLRIFFEYEALHVSRYNRLYALNTDYDFRFAEKNMAAELPGLPPAVQEEEPNEESEEAGWGNDWGNTDSGWGDAADAWEGESGKSDQDAWGDDWANEATTDDETTTEDVLAFTMAAEPMVALPEESGAIIDFKRADLVIVTQYDSTQIGGTKGTYLLDRHTFIGDGGKFDWSSAGLDANITYAELDQYSFNVRLPYLKAEKTKLTYKGLVANSVEGLFEFKSKKRSSPEDASYPRFVSYENNVRLEGLSNKNLTYVGGFALQGQRRLGVAHYGGLSKLSFAEQGERKFVTKARRYYFQDSLVSAPEASIAVYHGRDSITHPSVKFRYYSDQNRMSAIKEENGYEVRAWNSSYFNMTIDADIVDWGMDADSLNISIMNARQLLPALFRSNEYYNEEEIGELNGVYNFNPLMMVYNYGSRKAKKRDFYESEMVADVGANPKAVKAAMLQLHYQDFIDYDESSGKIYLKDKALHYVQSKNNRKDFDNLLIPSLATNQPNATLNLETNEMKVRGIDKFFISEILDVYIFPTENSIKLQKNRDFVFDGQLYAGNFEFVGRNFTFQYDSFLVDMANIDSIRFYIDDEQGQYQKRQVDNKLVSFDISQNESMDLVGGQSTSGTLYINRPENKSGHKIFPQFPIFNADRGAVVYFDNDDILDKAYSKSVYFIVPPFGIDSLSSSDPATIGFEGTFVAGGIFPDFKETLQIMPDNSLGFNHTIPPSGYKLYKGEAQLFEKITLDKNGLVGHGTMQYLTSESQSDNYVFYQDSVLAEGTNFRVNKGILNGTSYPDIAVDSYEMTWRPYQDEMYVSNTLDTFNLYSNTAALDGTINYSSKGVYGKGLMFTRGFESESEDFTFEESNLLARNSRFEMKSNNPEKPLMSGEDIRLEFDLAQDIAEISPEIEGMAAINYPFAQIKTSISKATWNLGERKVYMTKPEDVPLESSYFYTTREELDSLAFNAASAVYDLESSQLQVNGIPYITVADAYITPENNEVLILENAQIGTLSNTTIVLDTLNEYHRLVNGTIDILSRTRFTGSATYEYVNIMEDTFNIVLGEFELWEDPEVRNDLQQTISRGKVAPEDLFEISGGMYYKGDMTMYARHRALELDGYVKLDLQSRADYDTWIKYHNADEQTTDVMFDFNSAVTESGNSLNAGIHYESLNNSMYTAFAEDKKLDADDDFFRADGILFFDADKRRYVIGDTAKINGSKLDGKIFAYDDASGDIEFEGPVQFLIPNEHFQLTASGSGTGNVNQINYKLDALLKFDIDMPDQALTDMGNDVFEVVENFGAAEAEPDQDAFLYRVAEIIGDRAAMEYDKRNLEEYTPIANFTSKMIGSLVFSRANLQWSPEYNSWYSTEPLGLSHILRKDINATLDGFLEIRKAENGDKVSLFLQASPASWYYLLFDENKLITYSTNDAYNNTILDKSKIDKAGFGEYVFVLGDRQDAMNFINRFRLEYLGIKEPYVMETIPVETSPLEQLIQQPTEDQGEQAIPEELQQILEDDKQPTDDATPAEQQQTPPPQPKKNDLEGF